MRLLTAGSLVRVQLGEPKKHRQCNVGGAFSYSGLFPAVISQLVAKKSAGEGAAARVVSQLHPDIRLTAVQGKLRLRQRGDGLGILYQAAAVFGTDANFYTGAVSTHSWATYSSGVIAPSEIVVWPWRFALKKEIGRAQAAVCPQLDHQPAAVRPLQPFESVRGPHPCWVSGCPAPEAPEQAPEARACWDHTPADISAPAVRCQVPGHPVTRRCRSPRRTGAYPPAP